MSLSETDREKVKKISEEELAEKIVRETAPGPSNEDLFNGLEVASILVPAVIDDLNNWFNILDVRILGERHIGIPMRYRWTIIRWANQDMDSWLLDNGWEDYAHLNADTDSREPNEMEARYRKEYDSVTVDANFLVEFPEIVFDKMNDRDVEDVQKKKHMEEMKRNTLQKVLDDRRG